MMKLLILADDFTGALDTGIQFAQSGILTKVITDPDYDFNVTDSKSEVVVLNTESRSISPEDAYALVHSIALRARESEIPWIYKKTDSGLRGNIGAELAAVIDATKQQMFFAPALPEMNRVTREGTHYIEEVPVHQSVFGKDPFEPVKDSFIPGIIREQSAMTIATIRRGFEKNAIRGYKENLLLFDAEDENDLELVAQSIDGRGKPVVLAGCSSFAKHIKSHIPFCRNQVMDIRRTEKFIVISGSLNPITAEQIDFAEKKGFSRFRLPHEAKTTEDYFQTTGGVKTAAAIIRQCDASQRMIIDTLELHKPTERNKETDPLSLNMQRKVIADNLGDLMGMLMGENYDATYFITGGDTLMGFVRRNDNINLTPMTEVEKGAVLSQIDGFPNPIQVISKSGGFGDQRTLLNIADKVTKQ